jgi:hypothetical protein
LRFDAISNLLVSVLCFLSCGECFCYAVYVATIFCCGDFLANVTGFVLTEISLKFICIVWPLVLQLSRPKPGVIWVSQSHLEPCTLLAFWFWLSGHPPHFSMTFHQRYAPSPPTTYPSPCPSSIIFQHLFISAKQLVIWLDDRFLATVGLIHPNPGPHGTVLELSDLADLRGVEGMRVMYLNIRHLNNKIKNLESFLFECGGPSICCVAESWLQDDMDSRLLQIKSYKKYRFDRTKAHRSKGMVLYVHSSLTHNPPKCYKELDFALVCTKVTFQRHSYQLAFVYRPETNATVFRQNRFVSQLRQNLISIQCNLPLILIGDVNMDLNRRPTPPDSTRLLDMITNLGLEQKLKRPTRVTTSHGSLIDWVCLNAVDIPHKFQLLNFESHINTDHHCVGLVLPKIATFSADYHIHTYKTFPDFNRYDSAIVRRVLATQSWDDVYNTDNIDLKYQRFEDTIVAILSYASPTVKRRTCECVSFTTKISNLQPWYSRELRNQKTRCTQLHKLWKRAMGTQDALGAETSYRNAIKEYQKAYNKAHTQYNVNVLVRAKEQGNSQIKHRHLKALRGATEPSVIDKIHYNDHNHTDKLEIANALNEFFISVGRDAAASAERQVTPDLVTSAREIPNFYFRPPGFIETQKRLRAIKSSKPPGPGLIPGNFFREFADHLVFIVEHIFAHCVYRSTLPARWKESFITPIFKNKGVPTDPQNYRPIGITCVLSKVFEGFLCDSLVTHLESNNLLSKSQYGYRAGRSTLHAVTHLTEAIRQKLDHPNHPLVGVLFLDLSKAFDCVSHNLLLQMLPMYGMDHFSALLMRSFLVGRKQRVKLSDGTLSDQLISLSGVPQGSLLGPILFDLYINMLANQTTATTPQYADDTAVIRQAFNINDLVTLLHEDLLNLKAYFTKLGLLLNLSKTDYLLFGFNGPGDETCTIPVENQPPICPSEVATYLGVRIDYQLRFQAHIKLVINKLKFATRTLRKLRPHLTQPVANELMHSLFYSQADYCSLVWGQPEHAADTIKLEVQHRFALKAVYKKPRRTHNEEIYRISHSVSLFHRRMLNSALFVFKGLHRGLPDGWNDFFERSTMTRGQAEHRLILPRYSRNGAISGDNLKRRLALIWNALPQALRMTDNSVQFKRLLQEYHRSNFMAAVH